MAVHDAGGGTGGTAAPHPALPHTPETSAASGSGGGRIQPPMVQSPAAGAQRLGWNMRDVAEADPQRLLPGRVFRSSQVFNEDAVRDLRLRSAIDLRKAGRRASRAAKRDDDPRYEPPAAHRESSSVLAVSGPPANGDAQSNSGGGGGGGAGASQALEAASAAEKEAAAGDLAAGQPQSIPARDSEGGGCKASSRAARASEGLQSQTGQRLAAAASTDVPPQQHLAAAAVPADTYAELQKTSCSAGKGGCGPGDIVEGVFDGVDGAANRMLPRRDNEGFALAAGPDTLEEYGLRVYHVELLPPRVKLAIFWRMPPHLKVAAIREVFCCSKPQRVIAPAVADPRILGYPVLYCLMLDRVRFWSCMSKPYIRRALSVFAHPPNLPSVVHCTHGKDRTGLLTALLLLALGVPEAAVIADYVRSEDELKAERDGAVERGDISGYMVDDDIIASPAATMQATLRHLEEKYGGITGYLQAIKLPQDSLRAIRGNLLRPDLLAALPPAESSDGASGK